MIEYVWSGFLFTYEHMSSLSSKFKFERRTRKGRAMAAINRWKDEVLMKSSTSSGERGLLILSRARCVSTRLDVRGQKKRR